MKALKEVAEKYPICDECIGRLFPYVEGKNNRERGKKVREILGLKESKECYFCRGIFSRLNEIAKNLDVNQYEFETFILGTRLDPELIKREEMLLDAVGVVEGIESLKKNINRELGKKISEVYGKKYDPKNPDMEIVFRTSDERFELHPRPLFLYGRYRKYAPMPQSKWPCRYCKGRGCPRCDYTGRQWKETVEYYIADVLLGVVLGKETKLHAAGREDIDARMLGTGRPFVIEVEAPRRRKIDLEELRKEINAHGEGKVEVLCLEWSSKKEARELKEERFNKVYLAHVRCKGGIEEEELEKLRDLEGRVIEQRTPTRILHRRRDKVRKRKVIRLEWKVTGRHTFDLLIEAEHGLYIRELVSGDEGRTRPSVSEILGKECFVELLDVLEVKGGRPCTG